MNTIIRICHFFLFILLILHGVVIVVDPTFLSSNTSTLLLAAISVCSGIIYYFYQKRKLQNTLDTKIMASLFIGSITVYCLWVTAITLGWIDYNPTWLNQP
ncbi:hypothetical protein [Flavobacterium aurantiibacter]|nr:hypothetical protein [Flavobacterium aurantiibacter]